MNLCGISDACGRDIFRNTCSSVHEKIISSIYKLRVFPAVGQGFLGGCARVGCAAAIKWLPWVSDCA